MCWINRILLYDYMFFVLSTCDLPWIPQLVAHAATPLFFIYRRRHTDLIYLSGDLCRFLLASSGNSSPQISTVIILWWGTHETKSEIILDKWVAFVKPMHPRGSLLHPTNWSSSGHASPRGHSSHPDCWRPGEWSSWSWGCCGVFLVCVIPHCQLKKGHRVRGSLSMIDLNRYMFFLSLHMLSPESTNGAVAACHHTWTAWPFGTPPTLLDDPHRTPPGSLPWSPFKFPAAIIQPNDMMIHINHNERCPFKTLCQNLSTSNQIWK